MKETYLDMTIDVCHADGWGLTVDEPDEWMVRIRTWDTREEGRHYYADHVVCSTLVLDGLIDALQKMKAEIDARDAT